MSEVKNARFSRFRCLPENEVCLMYRFKKKHLKQEATEVTEEKIFSVLCFLCYLLLRNLFFFFLV